MKLDHRIREAETRLFARSGLQPEESFLDLASAKVRLRVLGVGAGPPLVMLHGVSLAAAVWAPWLADLAGYRALLVELPGHGLSGPLSYRPAAVRDRTLDMMDDLFDALGLAAAHDRGGRRKGNARTVASLMHAIDTFRRPRAGSVMTDGELGQITAPAMFCIGTGDPFLTPAQARPAVTKIPGSVLHEVPGGHGPWLEDPAGCAKLVTNHLTATRFAPSPAGTGRAV